MGPNLQTYFGRLGSSGTHELSNYLSTSLWSSFIKASKITCGIVHLPAQNIGHQTQIWTHPTMFCGASILDGTDRSDRESLSSSYSSTSMIVFPTGAQQIYLFISTPGTSPQGATKRNFYLPLTAMYGKWCNRPLETNHKPACTAASGYRAWIDSFSVLRLVDAFSLTSLLGLGLCM